MARAINRLNILMRPPFGYFEIDRKNLTNRFAVWQYHLERTLIGDRPVAPSFLRVLCVTDHAHYMPLQLYLLVFVLL